MDNLAIQFADVSKSFIIQEDKTFKEVVPSILFGRSTSRKIQVLSHISFNISRGETVGIVGKNGAGKSTILKLIAGITYPTAGKVVVDGKVAPLIELGAGFHHELTGYENIFLNAAIIGMHKKEIEARLEQIIDFSDLGEFIYTPVKKYSIGMYMRLGFSIAIHTNASILLIDEVLAVGDATFQKKCLNRLNEIKRSKEKTIVFVSHDEKSVKAFCDRAILIDSGNIIGDSTPKHIFAIYNDKTEHLIR